MLPTNPPRKRIKTKPIMLQQNLTQAQSPEQAIKEEKEVKRTSDIWHHFTPIQGSDPPSAACNYCAKSYAAHTKLNGTTSLWSHFEHKCTKNPYRKAKGQKTMEDYKIKGGDDCGKFKKFNVEDCRQYLSKMIIVDELPFKIVEGEGFMAYSLCLEPKFILPTRFTIARDCMKLFLNEKGKLGEALKDHRICLTIDTWTSIQNLNYMCLTGHWIEDDWKLQKRILNFCIVESHKGDVLGKHVENCLVEWGIRKVLTITVDNASSNDRLVAHLKKKSKCWKDVILDNDLLHMRCCAQIANLIVKEGLEEQHESVFRIQNAIKYVRSSQSRQALFKKCCEIERVESKKIVCLDVETRWNSTYSMLEIAEKFEKVFERLAEEDSKFIDYFNCMDGKKIIGPPTKEDWRNARNFVKFLKIFYEVTMKFLGSSYVTSNIFFREIMLVHRKLDRMILGNDIWLTTMAQRMKEKFEKYWGTHEDISKIKINFLLHVAIVLDPRYKLKYVSYCYKQIYGNDYALVMRMTSHVEKIFNMLYNEYNKCQPKEGSQVGCGFNSSHAINDDDDEINSQFLKEIEEEHLVENKSEIQKYLMCGCEIHVDAFNILDWWKINEVNYPILSKIARDVLACPVSTVSSESSFSTNGRVIDAFRSSLSPKMVEALICAQNWLRSSPKSIDLKEYFEDLEKYEQIDTEYDNRSTG